MKSNTKISHQAMALAALTLTWLLCGVYLSLTVVDKFAVQGASTNLWLALGSAFIVSLVIMLSLKHKKDTDELEMSEKIQSLCELVDADTWEAEGHSIAGYSETAESLSSALCGAMDVISKKLDVNDALADFDQRVAKESNWPRILETIIGTLSIIAPDHEKSVVFRFSDTDSSHYRIDPGSNKPVKQRVRLSESEESQLYRNGGLDVVDMKAICPSITQCQPNFDSQSGYVFPLATDSACYGFIFLVLDQDVTENPVVGSSLRSLAARAGAALGRSERETTLYRQAHFDSLTGLPNRVLLADRTNQALRLAKRHQHRVGLMFIDLDGFKRINDSLGHSAGDKLLQGVAERLRTCIRDSDTVARLAGDEFVVLVSEITDSEQSNLVIGGIAKTIQNAVSRPFELNGKFVRVTPSVGIAVSSTKANSYDALLQAADTAMYTAKSNGEGTIRFFKRDMSTTVVERMSLETELALAIDKKQLCIEYQPQIELTSGEIIGVEGLLRWDHPTRGRISPARFIPLAEDSGIMSVIGNWALRKCCADAADWHRQGILLPLSVNVSSAQLKQADMGQFVERVLSEFKIEPSLIFCEISESTAMHDTMHTANMLSQLHEIGVKIAIDDFGTSYSSLSNLSEMPVSRLKIDKRFIDDLSLNNSARTIIDAIVGLGHGLGLQVVGEGVEHEVQQRLLKEANCDLAQGYYFAEPMPASEMLEFLSTRKLKSQNNVLHFQPKIQT